MSEHNCLIEEEDLEFLTTLAVKWLNSNTTQIAEKGIFNVVTFTLDVIKAVALFTKENGIRSFLLLLNTVKEGSAGPTK